jgi:single-strand DNA-binding protein
MSVNKAILVGNLGKDPEIRFTGTGRAVCKFPLATTTTWNDNDGNKQERTEWHNVIVWGKQGENCGKFLSKGRQVFVEGEIRSRSYDDKDGNKRYITEIIAMNVRFLGGGAGGGRGAAGSGDPGFPEEPAMGMGGGGAAAADDDDIPF